MSIRQLRQRLEKLDPPGKHDWIKHTRAYKDANSPVSEQVAYLSEMMQAYVESEGHTVDIDKLNASCLEIVMRGQVDWAARGLLEEPNLSLLRESGRTPGLSETLKNGKVFLSMARGKGVV